MIACILAIVGIALAIVFGLAALYLLFRLIGGRKVVWEHSKRERVMAGVLLTGLFFANWIHLLVNYIFA